MEIHNLLSSILFQRNNLNELLKQIATLQQWYINISYEIKHNNNNDYDNIKSDDIKQLFWNIREKLTIITQCVNTLITVYSKVILICKQKNKKENQSKKRIINEIFNSDELTQFEEFIPDFIGDEDYNNDIDCSKINDPIIQSLINSKTYINNEYNNLLIKIKQIENKLNKYKNITDEITIYKLSPQKYELMYHENYIAFWSVIHLINYIIFIMD